MRIAFVLNSLQTGGAEIHTVGLAAALKARGHDCLLAPLLPRTEIDTRGVERADIGGNGLGNVAAMLRLGNLLRDWRAERVIAVNERPLMYAHMSRVVGGPVLPTVAIYHTTDLQTGRQRFLHRLAEPMFARSDALVYVSGNQRRKWAADGLTARHVEIIRNGIDARRFSRAVAAKYRDRQRAALELAPGDYVVGLSAAFRPEKNHIQAVDAVGALRARNIAAKLLLVGDGPTMPQVRSHVSASGLDDVVIFAGRQADVVPYLSAFDVGLLASTAIETFSLAALEFMGLGVPGVLSDIGGASEMVDEGLTGHLFPAGDTAALVAALADLADPARRRAMGGAAAKKVQANFTHDKMVARYEALFREVGA